MIARISLYIVAAVLIAAHFVRVGNLIGVALCLAAPLLFLVRRRWSLMLLQWLAYVAAAIWLAIAWQIVELRLAFGQPWLRAMLILAAVAGVSMLAGFLLHGNAVQVRYRGC
jgi:hypothetical protein